MQKHQHHGWSVIKTTDGSFQTPSTCWLLWCTRLQGWLNGKHHPVMILAADTCCSNNKMRPPTVDTCSDRLTAARTTLKCAIQQDPPFGAWYWLKQREPFFDAGTKRGTLPQLIPAVAARGYLQCLIVHIPSAKDILLTSYPLSKLPPPRK